MRKLLPYAGIAVAVAGGVALAPYFWWVLVVLAGAAGVAWLRREHGRVWAGLGLVACLAVLFAWPLWLVSLGQYADAAFAFVLVTVIGFWSHIKALARPYWLKVFPD